MARRDRLWEHPTVEFSDDLVRERLAEYFKYLDTHPDDPLRPKNWDKQRALAAHKEREHE